ncbi:DUF2125 domain-containing protein [Albirhodobacter sp. R86504]|uniref:DUF2125 domain-containing protein n=1 Tax=Albirhodobacter sp. R86504 TaxID=3093848 RepID=UPI0036715DBB
MSLKKSLVMSTALAAFAIPAQADISPDDVWGLMQEYYTSAGLTVTAKETAQGSDLILRDVVMTFPNETGDAVLTIPELRLADDGGEVTLTMSDKARGVMSNTALDGSEAKTEIELIQTDLVAQISGDVDDMKIVFDLPAMAIEARTDQPAGLNGEESLPVTMRFTAENLRGTETVTSGMGMQVASDFQIERLGYTATGADPQGEGTFTSSGEINDATMKFDMKTPEDAASTDLATALENGMRMSGEMKFGQSTGSSEADGPMGAMTTKTTAQTGTLAFNMDQTGARYCVSSAEATADVAMPSLPFPIHLDMASATGGLQIPMVPGEAAPVGVELRMENVTVNDEVWAMFDPSGHLPRTPASIVVDLEGMGKVTGEIGASVDMAATGQVPFELQSVALKSLQVKLMGADLTGSGAATIDNAAGIPMPAGAVDLRLEGGNALIDNLVATGLLPSDQLMGVRMMLGLFAVPAGDDVLTSKIEMREDGGVYANGQRLR